jgi:hypothetical protein
MGSHLRREEGFVWVGVTFVSPQFCTSLRVLKQRPGKDTCTLCTPYTFCHFDIVNNIYVRYKDLCRCCFDLPTLGSGKVWKRVVGMQVGHLHPSTLSRQVTNFERKDRERERERQTARIQVTSGGSGGSQAKGRYLLDKYEIICVHSFPDPTLRPIGPEWNSRCGYLLPYSPDDVLNFAPLQLYMNLPKKCPHSVTSQALGQPSTYRPRKW